MFLLNIWYFSNVWCQNQIFFKCFVYKYDSFWIFCIEIYLLQIIWTTMKNIWIFYDQNQMFLKLWGKPITFWMFWVKISYFLNILFKKINITEWSCTNMILVQPFRWISIKLPLNVLDINHIPFKCFGQKSDTCQMFWV